MILNPESTEIVSLKAAEWAGFDVQTDRSSSSSKGIISNALMFVASRSTGQAIPWFSASSHVLAHTHQESPGFSPGKLNCGIGVIKSLPCILANSRNSSVTIQQTVWEPLSISSVLQLPSLYQPVIGLQEHSPISWPKTFFCIATLHRGKCHTSNCVLVFLIHHLNQFGDFVVSTSSVWTQYEHSENENRLQPIFLGPREVWGRVSKGSFFSPFRHPNIISLLP